MGIARRNNMMDEDELQGGGNEELTKDTFFDKFKSIFSDTTNKPEEVLNPFAAPKQAPTQPQQPQQPAAQGQGQGKEADAFTKLVDSKNFNFELDGEKLSDPAYVKDVFNQVSKRAYAEAMQDSMRVANNIIEQKMKVFADTMHSRMDNKSQGDKLMDQAKTVMPNMATPDRAPIIAEVMGRFLQQGVPADQVVAHTQKYFSRVADSFTEANTEEYKETRQRKENMAMLFPELTNRK